VVNMSAYFVDMLGYVVDMYEYDVDMSGGCAFIFICLVAHLC